MSSNSNFAVKIVKADHQPTISIDSLNEDDWTKVDLKEKQFIARVHYSPINPIDVGMSKGYFLQQDKPFTPGYECNGTIVRAFDGKIVGKKVCFLAIEGSWKSYALGSEDKMVEVSNLTEQTSLLILNPCTVLGLLDTIKDYDCFINSAANSACGQLLIKLAQRNKKKVINIVRSQKRVEELEHLKADNILYLEDPQFDQKLKALVEQLNCKVYLDCYAGELANRIICQLPPSGLMVSYGFITSNKIIVDGFNIVGLERKIEGFNVGNFCQKHPNQYQEFLKDIQNNYELYYQNITKVIQLNNQNDVSEGINDVYSQTGGKVVFKIIN